MQREELKKQSAAAAVQSILPRLRNSSVLGVGSGSTVDLFIDQLAPHRHLFDGAVAASENSARRLAEHQVPVHDLNSVDEIPVFVDGCDEIDAMLQMIKGGGGALAREKVLGYAAREFLCIADHTKYVDALGAFPLPVEVLPMARSLVARTLVGMGGVPVYRQGFVTDNGNVILDVRGLELHPAVEMERRLNDISGVVCNGIFALRPADRLLLATQDGVQEMQTGDVAPV